jgi:spermidine synthase
MKTFIYPEMMVHVPLCTHKEPTQVLIVSDSAAVLEKEVARHHDVAARSVAASKALDALRDEVDQSADVILLEGTTDAAAVAHANRVLRADGLMVMQHPDLDDENANKALMQVLGNYFKIIMPYHVGDGTTLLLASKAYHPTADLVLQRADLLEGQEYYNCDIHPAAFAMPNYVRKAYLGIVKN